MIFDSLKNSALYYSLNPRLEKAFGFIASTDWEKMEPGIHELDGKDIYVNVMDTELKKPADAKLEIHSPSRVMEEKADMTWAGYIKETEALQPDVAEAMSGMAGAGVEAFSAEEIQAVGIAPQLMAYLASYQAGNAISAESGEGGGGGSIVIYFEPQYDLAGVTNAAELEAILAAHDEDMRELILEVLQEAGVDAARRAYT